MANHNPAEQPQGIDTVSIPHSGQLEGPMQELPTRRFDKTLLEEAHEQNLITIPDSVNLEQGIDSNEDENTNSGRKKVIAGGIAVTTLAFGAGAAGFALGGSSGEGDTPNTIDEAANTVVDDAETDAILDTPPSETTITVEGESPVQTPETQDSPNYTYLSDSESALLDRLSQDGYPTIVLGNHEFDSNNPEGLLVSVGNDILAALNTRDIDAFVQAIGGNERSDMANHEDMQRQIEALDDFYALEDYVRLNSCTSNGNEVTCSGYIGVFAFNSNSDLNDPDTVEFLENPVLEKPTNSGQRYLELVDVRFNTETGELINAGHRIISHEPSLN